MKCMNSRKYTIIITLTLLFFLQFVLADIIIPDESKGDLKTIPINHRIININDYQDYIFFTTADNVNKGLAGFDMCPLKIIGSD
ncbi:MAG: hypothetical protein QXW97_04345 [Candidatus Pacearchaeota archaeon]